jgi:hypothetical protein
VGDEYRHLKGRQFPGGHIQRDGVGGDEQVTVVPVKLRTLTFLDGVLDGEPVQVELLADRGKAGRVGCTHVQPHRDARLRDVVGDVVHRKVFELENTATVQPRTCHTGRLEGGLPGRRAASRHATREGDL